MVSEKQKQANARNAQLATGPITPEGKTLVSGNAIKHGIFAKDLVINAGDGREDEMEYHDLLAELKRDLAPVGRMEMLLVEKIAVNYWRLRRLLRHETGEIRVKLDDYKESALDSHYSGSYLARKRPELEYYRYDDDISDAEYQEQRYRVASIQGTGYDMVKDKAALDYVLCWRLDRDDAKFSDKDYKAAQQHVDGLSPQLRGKLRREILGEAEKVLAEMDEVRSWRVKFDRIHKVRSLPGEKDLNNIIKYENSLERSILRNLAVLKTLQENRARPGAGDNEFLDPPA